MSVDSHKCSLLQFYCDEWSKDEHVNIIENRYVSYALDEKCLSQRMELC